MAWQIDAFGHTAAEARLFEEMGFEMLVVGRLNDTLKKDMDLTGDRQFIWQPRYSGRSPGGYVDGRGIFTQVLYESYNSPCYLKTSMPWSPNAVPDILLNEILSLKRFTANYVQCLYEMAKTSKTKNILVPFGDDFAFSKAE